MIRNYLKSALRDLQKHKTFSVINVLGLSVGLASSLLIGLYINYERGYDKFHKDAENIYRFTRESKGQDGTLSLHFSNIAPPFGPLLKQEFEGEIETLGRFMTAEAIVRADNKSFAESNFGFADPEILDVLTFRTIAGVLKDALVQPNAVAISASIAQKYFGAEEAMGKTLMYNTDRTLVVKGVFEDFPTNSTIQLDLITDMTIVEEFMASEGGMMRAWDNNILRTMFRLKEGSRIKEIEEGLDQFMIKHLGQDAPNRNELHIQKLTEVHLNSNLSDEKGLNGSLAEVRIFTILAGLILAIACANYMNLATGRLMTRAKGVGIRKVLGADRSNLIKQYLTESVLMVMISLIIALASTIMSIPFFKQLTGLEFEFSLIEYGNILITIVVSALLLGFMMGIYPSFYLSAQHPVKVLKQGLMAGRKRGVGLRKVLVVVQFLISAVLIVATMVVYQQLHYLNNKSLGYDRDEIIVMKLSNEVNEQYRAFKSELLKIPGVKSAGGSSRVPSGELLDSNRAFIERSGKMQALDAAVVIKKLGVDPDFIPTYKMNLVAGRNFSDDQIGDSGSFILNQKSVKAIGWGSAQEAINKTMIYDNVRGTVIGVTEDFHFESLRKEIGPMILLNRPSRARHLSVKLAAVNIDVTVKSIEKIYSTFGPNAPMDYNFLDERFELLYKAETRRSQLFIIFATLAIFLACLGLFGLTLFAISQRSKEISIRKVLGASVNQIVGILSKEFVILIVVSMVLAFPVVWYFMGDWLDSYAYRIDMGWIPFVAAAAIAGAIAFVTIGMQTFKAAVSNPSDRLRDE